MRGMLPRMILHLVSGLIGETRKIRGDELIALAEASATPAGANLGAILGSCWKRTIDPGPYKWLQAGPGSLPWNKILTGDLVDGALRLRADSVPNGFFYEFPIKCRACGEIYNWQIDIIRDLKRKRLPKSSFDIIRSGDCRFHTSYFDEETGANREVTFKLMTSDDDKPMRALMKRLGRKKFTVVEQIAQQTTSIEGANTDLAHLHRHIGHLSIDPINQLRHDMDEADCGVTIEILTTCDKSECRSQQETELPFDRRFFSPKIPTNEIPAGFIRSPDPEEEAKTSGEKMSEEKTPEQTAEN